MTTKSQELHTDTQHNRATGALRTVGKDVKPLQQFWTKFNNDWAMNLSGMLAYNLLMAMLPIAIALLSILGLILGRLDPTGYTNLVHNIQGILPAQVSTDTIKSITNQLKNDAGFIGLIAILLAIWNGSRLFVNIEGCFGFIYHLRPRPFLQQNLVAVGMLLLFIVLIPVMVLASLGPAFVLSILKNTPLSQLPGSGFIFGLGGILGGLLAAWLLFEAIYIIVPNQKIIFRNSWLGALVAAVALELYLALFPLYTPLLTRGLVGPVGFAVILLVFFYYFAVILLLGAEVNAFFAEGIRATPSDLVTLVHSMTSHIPKSKEAQQEQAAPSHKVIPTGSVGEKSPNDAANELAASADTANMNTNEQQ